MSSLKTVISICAQDLRKWQTDHRVRTIAVLAVIIVQIYVDDMRRISDGLGTAMPVWIFPFLYSQFHTKLIFTLPIVLLFCNAPFTDRNQIFVYIRTGRTKWLCGQVLYIAAASAVYYIFLLIVTILSTLFNGGDALDWGKTLTTTANSNAALYFDSPFIDVSSVVVRFFSPFSACWFTFLLSWLCAVMLGLILFLCNIVSGTRFIGIAITSTLIVLSALVNNSFPQFLKFSPVSWNTLDNIDIGGRTTKPSFAYCIVVYAAVIVLLIAAIFIFGKKNSLDVKEG
ncbi:MAG: hypothetical protein HDR72_04905 [Ruminococcaceae bacterium]|nr:hypothetical protein [Oscillospiraceae bacterium]